MQKELEYFDKIQMLKRHNFWLLKDKKLCENEIQTTTAILVSLIRQINTCNTKDKSKLTKDKIRYINLQGMLIDLRTRIVSDIYDNGIEIRKLRLSNSKLTKEQIKVYNQLKGY